MGKWTSERCGSSKRSPKSEPVKTSNGEVPFTHTKDEWLGFIAEWIGKAEMGHKYRHRMIQIAALAVAAIESHDRGKAIEDLG